MHQRNHGPRRGALISAAFVTDIHLDVAGEARLHRALRRCWHPVCRVDDLQNKPLPVALLDEQLVVVRLGVDRVRRRLAELARAGG